MRLKTIKSKKAFTLVEITIAIGIIVLLTALSIHSLIRAKINSNEAAAITNLKILHSVFASYRAVNPTYPESLDILAAEEPPYISSALSDGRHQGYDYKVLESDKYTFRLAATPVKKGITGSRFFVVDRSGDIQEVSEDSIYSEDTVPAGTPNI